MKSNVETSDYKYYSKWKRKNKKYQHNTKFNDHNNIINIICFEEFIVYYVKFVLQNYIFQLLWMNYENFELL